MLSSAKFVWPSVWAVDVITGISLLQRMMNESLSLWNGNNHPEQLNKKFRTNSCVLLMFSQRIQPFTKHTSWLVVMDGQSINSFWMTSTIGWIPRIRRRCSFDSFVAKANQGSCESNLQYFALQTDMVRVDRRSVSPIWRKKVDRTILNDNGARCCHLGLLIRNPWQIRWEEQRKSDSSSSTRSDMMELNNRPNRKLGLSVLPSLVTLGTCRTSNCLPNDLHPKIGRILKIEQGNKNDWDSEKKSHFGNSLILSTTS